MELLHSFEAFELPEPVYLLDEKSLVEQMAVSIQVRERAEGKVFRKDPREDFVLTVLPVLDGFERLFSISGESESQESEILKNWIKAIESLYKRMLKSLQRIGVEPVESLGKALDLEVHEVARVVLTEEHPTGTILEEIERGYWFNGKVLRAAKVAVAKNEVSKSRD